VYTWGRGFEGQTGHASKALSAAQNDVVTAVQLLPKCVSMFVKHPISCVACGHNFTAITTVAGAVYTWGEGGSGQLGTGRCTKRAVPALVFDKCPATGEPFVSVECGWGHTLALTKEGTVYSWGLNTYGQLGLGDTKTRHTPECILGKSGEGVVDPVTGHKANFVRVKAASNYSMCMTSDGDLYVMGCNGGSQLGLDDAEHRFEPTFVEELRGKVSERRTRRSRSA